MLLTAVRPPKSRTSLSVAPRDTLAEPARGPGECRELLPLTFCTCDPSGRGGAVRSVGLALAARWPTLVVSSERGYPLDGSLRPSNAAMTRGVRACVVCVRTWRACVARCVCVYARARGCAGLHARITVKATVGARYAPA